MAKTQDFTKVMQEMLATFPVDTQSLQTAFKTHAHMGEKLAKVALEAVEKSAELSSKWTKEAISRVGVLTSVKEEPADYSKAFSDFASAAAEIAAENLAAFAEIAKKAQMDTVELMLASGKSASEDAAASLQRATSEVASVARKAAAAAR